MRAAGCGVVTASSAAVGTSSSSDSVTSPVPGGRSRAGRRGRPSGRRRGTARAPCAASARARHRLVLGHQEADGHQPHAVRLDREHDPAAAPPVPGGCRTGAAPSSPRRRRRAGRRRGPGRPGRRRGSPSPRTCRRRPCRWRRRRSAAPAPGRRSRPPAQPQRQVAAGPLVERPEGDLDVGARQPPSGRRPSPRPERLAQRAGRRRQPDLDRAPGRRTTTTSPSMPRSAIGRWISGSSTRPTASRTSSRSIDGSRRNLIAGTPAASA